MWCGGVLFELRSGEDEDQNDDKEQHDDGMDKDSGP